MAKKSYKFEFDSPVVITFTLICTAIFLLDSLALKFKITPLLFTCPGTKAGFPAELLQGFPAPVKAFNFTNPLHFLSIILHIFGNASWPQLLVNSAILLTLGATLEERYGSPVLILMAGISALVSGVLCATVSNSPVTGSANLVFMCIILASMVSLTKRKVPVSLFMALTVFLAYRLSTAQSMLPSDPAVKNTFLSFLRKNLCTVSELTGGIAGSLFGFLVAPKKRAPSKRTAAAKSHPSQSADSLDSSGTNLD